MEGEVQNLGMVRLRRGRSQAGNGNAARALHRAGRRLETSGGNHTLSQGVVTGKLPAIMVASALHAGWPQPLTLTPSCWPG